MYIHCVFLYRCNTRARPNMGRMFLLTAWQAAQSDKWTAVVSFFLFNFHLPPNAPPFEETLSSDLCVKTASTVSKLFQNVPEHSSIFWTFVPDSCHFPSFFDVSCHCSSFFDVSCHCSSFFDNSCHCYCSLMTAVILIVLVLIVLQIHI